MFLLFKGFPVSLFRTLDLSIEGVAFKILVIKKLQGLFSFAKRTSMFHFCC